MRHPAKLVFILAVGAAGSVSSLALAQAKITTTGRVYAPAQQAQNQTENEVTQDVEVPEPAASESDEEEVEQAEQPTEITDDRLNLVCIGGGSANKASVGTLSGWNSYGGTFGGTVFGQRSQGFADQVRIRLDDNDPRIRMPRTMLPLIRGGKDGWFKLRDVEYGEGEIRTSIAVSMYNNPKLRLDRYTGAISISGKAGDFTGECHKFDPDAVEKAF